MALENTKCAACTQRFLEFLQPCGNYGQLMIYIMDLRPSSFSTFLSQYQESYFKELKKMAQRFPSSPSPLVRARKRRPAHIEPTDARLDLRIVDFMDSVESSLFEGNFYKRYPLARLMRFY
jgi:hypothetical protein